MRKNMGQADRVIRALLAAVFAILYFTGTLGGAIGLTLVIVSGVFLLTSLISFCPLYFLLGINSLRKKTDAVH